MKWKSPPFAPPQSISSSVTDLLEDVFSHVRVHSRQRVIEHVNVGTVVQGTGQRHSRPLTTTQVDATLACRQSKTGRSQIKHKFSNVPISVRSPSGSCWKSASSAQA